MATKSKNIRAPRVEYSEDLTARICEMVGSGLTLQDVCRLPDMPDRSTVYDWFGKYPAFTDMYARAREERADMVADEVVTIADTTDDPNKARVQIDARKWWAARVSPKKYGDKIQTENTTTTYVVSDKPMSTDEWESKYCLATPGGTTGSTH